MQQKHEIWCHLMWLLGCQNALKYALGWGSAADPLRELTSISQTLWGTLRLGKTGKFSQAPQHLGALPSLMKLNKLSVCSISQKNFTAIYGNYAVCAFTMSYARHCTGIPVEYQNIHICPIKDYIFNFIFIWCFIYFGLCPIKICQCSGMTVLRTKTSSFFKYI